NQWELGGPAGPLGQESLHVLLMLFATDGDALDRHSRSQKERAAAGGLKLLYEQACRLNPDDAEPFGFKDGLSDPSVEGFNRKHAKRQFDPQGSEASGKAIRAGEFILGYANEYGRLPITPTVKTEQDGGGILPWLPPDPGQPERPRTQSDVKDFGQNG